MDLSNVVRQQQAPQDLARVLDPLASEEAFRFFQEKRFRQLVQFDTLTQTEQDRIFNELVIAPITLIMLTLEAPDLRVDTLRKEYYLKVKNTLPETHIGVLKELGIEKKYLKLWEKLLAMRYEEYGNDKQKIREIAIGVENIQPPKDLSDIQLILPLQAVAVGCHHHICRGETKEKDELFLLIHRWLSRFYLEVRVPLEGGKITWWMRVWHKLKRTTFASVSFKVRV